MADSSVTTCQGIVAMHMSIQKHVFYVRTHVVNINSSFNIAVRSTIMVNRAPRVVLDYDNQTIALQKRN